MIILNTVDRAGVCVCDRICLDILRYTYYGYSNCARNRSQVKFKQVQTILTWHDQHGTTSISPLNWFHPKASRQMGQRVSASWTAGPTSMYSVKSTSSPGLCGSWVPLLAGNLPLVVSLTVGQIGKVWFLIGITHPPNETLVQCIALV